MRDTVQQDGRCKATKGWIDGGIRMSRHPGQEGERGVGSRKFCDRSFFNTFAQQNATLQDIRPASCQFPPLNVIEQRAGHAEKRPCMECDRVFTPVTCTSGWGSKYIYIYTHQYILLVAPVWPAFLSAHASPEGWCGQTFHHHHSSM